MNVQSTFRQRCLGTAIVLMWVSLYGAALGTSGDPSNGRATESMVSSVRGPAASPVVPQLRMPLLEGRLTPVETPDRIPVILNDEAAQHGGTAGARAEAYLYKNTYDSGFALFLNFGSATGAVFPGTMIADEMGLSTWRYGVITPISAYELTIYRSPLDPLDGLTLADFHVELWNGDPLGLVDTPGSGYAGAKIPGSEGSFTGIPGPGIFTLRVELDPPLDISALPPRQRVWMVLYGEDTCRTGWRISGQMPEVGSILMEFDTPFGDLFEAQSDYDGQFSGLGACCDGSGACQLDGPGAPGEHNGPCPGDEGSWPRGFCSDGDAESAGIYNFGGPCTGGLSDFCASFVASIWGPTDTTMSLLPRRSSGPSTINSDAIVLDTGGQQVWLELEIAGWDPDLDGTPKIRNWNVVIDSAGFSSGPVGTLAIWKPSCESDAECEGLMGSEASECMLEEGPPYCTAVFQDFSEDPTLRLDLHAAFECGDPPAACFGGLDFDLGRSDDGVPHYGGTLVVDVPPDARGRFTIGFTTSSSWMEDEFDHLILTGLIPAKITIPPASRCCYGPATPALSCVEGITAGECAQLPDSHFEEGKTCSDPCPGCQDDWECSDEHRCTVDSCDRTSGACVHAGDDSLCDDGNPCTDDVCAETFGCWHPILPPGSPCDDGDYCTFNEVCDGMDTPSCTGTDVGSVSCAAPEDCEAVTGGNWACVDSFCFCDPCFDSDAPQPESSPVAKSRMISFVPGNAGRSTALRVSLTDLPLPFDGHNGRVMWVGEPHEYCEASHDDWPPCSNPPDTYTVAPLQCEPLYRDWGGVGDLHVHGLAIMPDALYDVQAISEGCYVIDEDAYSVPLTLGTVTDFGDLVGDCTGTSCTLPNGTTDFIDITAMVDKYRDLPGALSKTRTDLAGYPSGLLDQRVTFTDIAAEVDAFRGRPYWFEGPPDCP